MAYRLKQINYTTKTCHILLQNENGPCPLLAAANCLLLKGTISLPSNCIGAGVVTIDELVNVLAEKILSNQAGGQADHHVQEVLTIFPGLQFGMDVNPKFTSGPTGVEYTMHLNAFDLLHIELVHGWLLEPDAQEYDLIGNQTYNQLINMVIEGNDASSALAAHENNPHSHLQNHDELSTKATKGSLVKHFLDRSSHQLTQYGLTTLHEYLKDGQMVVFFRNNHFNTLTKHEGLLYLLVTDFGYANVGNVVWERLDVIDGDTEFVTDNFSRPSVAHEEMGAAAATPEQLVANNIQSQADYQLALQLSQETSVPASGGASAAVQPGTFTASNPDAELEAARQASLRDYHQTQQQNSSTPNQPITNIAEAMRQAGNSVYDAPTSALPASAPSPAATSNTMRPETVAVGVPAAPPSQEEQDLMIAMQLQREEEREQSERLQQQEQRNAQSAPLVQAMGRYERNKQRQHASRPSAPPSALPTAPTARNSRSGGGKEGCVIS